MYRGPVHNPLDLFEVEETDALNQSHHSLQENYLGNYDLNKCKDEEEIGSTKESFEEKLPETKDM